MKAKMIKNYRPHGPLVEAVFELDTQPATFAKYVSGLVAMCDIHGSAKWPPQWASFDVQAAVYATLRDWERLPYDPVEFNFWRRYGVRIRES